MKKGADSWPSHRERLRLFALFGIETLALDLAQTPLVMKFFAFSCTDSGGSLTAHHLLSRGYRPEIDFGYHYGLAGLLAGEGWFGVFGASPPAYQAAMLIFGLAIAWGIAGVVSRLKLGRPGVMLIVVALPFAVRASYLNLVHVVEAALLSNALAEQLVSKRRALALATAAGFAKPSMGYVYVLLLLILGARDLRGCNELNAAAVTRLVWPAAATGAVLAALLGFWFGWIPLVRTLLPVRGRQVYRLLKFGFWNGMGRCYWYLPGVHLAYYFGSYVGLWLLGTWWLTGFAGYALVRQRKWAVDEIVITCGALHLSFITLMYGHFSSWTYYSYILLTGLAATSIYLRGRALKAGYLALALLGLTSSAVTVRSGYRAYRDSTPSSDTAGLWSSAAERQEWLRVREIARGRRAAFLYQVGAGSLLAPGFMAPTALFALPGSFVPGELQREAAQLAAADVVVNCVNPDAGERWFDSMPELAMSLRETVSVFRGDHFAVYARRPGN